MPSTFTIAIRQARAHLLSSQNHLAILQAKRARKNREARARKRECKSNPQSIPKTHQIAAQLAWQRKAVRARRAANDARRCATSAVSRLESVLGTGKEERAAEWANCVRERQWLVEDLAERLEERVRRAGAVAKEAAWAAIAAQTAAVVAAEAVETETREQREQERELSFLEDCPDCFEYEMSGNAGAEAEDMADWGVDVAFEAGSVLCNEQDLVKVGGLGDWTAAAEAEILLKQGLV